MTVAAAPLVDGLAIGSKDDDDVDLRYFAHPIFYIGDDVPPVNEPVVVRGKMIADPRDSRMTVVANHVKPIEKKKYMSRLSPITEEYVTKTDIDSIVKDLEVITGISGQREMLKSYLILFFMPVVFEMDGRVNGKHTAEICVIGDPRQGKSTAMRAMQKHFGAGTFLSCEGATFAGLVGGMADFGGRAGRMFAWGPVPLADGKLVFMDEFDGLVEDGTFSKMTSIRSDGIASRIVAGVNNRTNARVRMAWAANPIGNRDLSKYDSTLAAIRELIKAPQDIARFEFFIGVHRNTKPEFIAGGNVGYTHAIASNHVRWAWAQYMKIDSATSAFCDTYGAAIAKKFKGLPTLPITESRWKVARIACAFALIRGSTTVTEEDTIQAAMFLDSIYDHGKTLDSVSARAIDVNGVAEAIKSFGGETFAKRLTRSGKKGIDRDSLMRMHSMVPSYVGKMNYEQAMHELCDKNPALNTVRGVYYPTDEFSVMLEGMVK